MYSTQNGTMPLLGLQCWSWHNAGPINGQGRRVGSHSRRTNNAAKLQVPYPGSRFQICHEVQEKNGVHPSAYLLVPSEWDSFVPMLRCMYLFTAWDCPKLSSSSPVTSHARASNFLSIRRNSRLFSYNEFSEDRAPNCRANFEATTMAESLSTGPDLCQVPSATPPDGILPNLKDPPSLAAALIVVTTIMMAWAIIFLAGRLWTNRRRLQLADGA